MRLPARDAAGSHSAPAWPAHVEGIEVAAWSIEPPFAIALAGAGLVYLLAWLAVSRVPERRWPRRRALAWFGGLASLAAAYGGPVEAYSDDSLASHMVQHLILLQLAPPLLLFGRPIALLRNALPGLFGSRRGRPATAGSSGLRPFAERQATPAILVGLIFNLNLLLWHLPPAYDAALRSPRVHAAEHLGFLISALAFWWLVLRSDPSGRPATHAAYGLCFAACMAGMLVALALVFAAAPLYPWYLQRPRSAHPLGWDALWDQRVGGGIMFAGGLAYLLLLLRMLAKEAGAR